MNREDIDDFRMGLYVLTRNLLWIVGGVLALAAFVYYWEYTQWVLYGAIAMVVSVGGIHGIFHMGAEERRRRTRRRQSAGES